MIKVINGGIAPTKGSKYSACVDLRAREDVTIGAGETKIVRLGVRIDLEKLLIANRYANLHLKNISTLQDDDKFLKSHYLQLEPRSSLRAKGLIAGTGIIDIDYEDEIGIIIHNPTKVAYEKAEDTSGYIECDDNFKIKKGDKIAQIMLCEHKTSLLGIESEEERQGGYGSTGN